MVGVRMVARIAIAAWIRDDMRPFRWPFMFFFCSYKVKCV